jgi:O-antigen biosynthesis protein
MNFLRRLLAAYSPGFSRGSLPPAEAYPIDDQNATVADLSFSILIPTAGRANRVLRCLETIRARSTYANYEILVVDNGPLPKEVEAALTAFDIRRLTVVEPFNFAANLNAAARRADGDFLLFLNDDTEVITPDWLESLYQCARQPKVGAVGAKLLFPNGRLQHAGVALVEGSPGHPWYGETADSGPTAPREWLAVTGACLMTPRSLFLSCGGFDERFSLNYNDVDYCMRLHELGWRILYTPHVELIHHEAMDRPGQSTVRPCELALFKQLWGARYPDPFFPAGSTSSAIAAPQAA